MQNKILIIAVMCLVIVTDVVADDMGNIIQYFNEDFKRETPGDLALLYKKKIENISKLTMDRQLTINVKTRGELKKEYKELYSRGTEDEDLGRKSALEFILKTHGLLKENDKYEYQFFYSTYDEMAGYYDIENKSMVLVESVSKEAIRGTLLHEMVHAAQDEYLDLKNIYFNDDMSLDQFFANTSLIEGQAEVVGYLNELYGYSNEFDEIELIKQFDEWLAKADPDPDEPFALFKSFPYRYGMTFVLEQYLVKKKRDFKMMLDRMPETTEQVLHRSKYYKNEKRLETKIEKINFSSDNAGEPELLFRSSLGELYILQMLNNIQSPDRMVNASIAEGWGGDHIVVLKNNNKTFTVWEIVWDTADDAVEFFNAYENFYMKTLNDKIGSLAKQDIVLDEKNNKVFIYAGDLSDGESYSLFKNIAL